MKPFMNMKKIDKLLLYWFFAFSIMLFLGERFCNQVVTSRIAWYIYFGNAALMGIVRIVYEIVKRKKNKKKHD